MNHHFHICNIFTSPEKGGNPLAVVLDTKNLTDTQMQQMATAFNFSETTFVFPPENPANTVKMRIFTPNGELPFAGHPTIGTAFILAYHGIIPTQSPYTDIVLEQKVGLVPVRIFLKEHDFLNESTSTQQQKITHCLLTTAVIPSEYLTPEIPAPEAFASTLGLHPEDFAAPAQAWSAGTPYWIIPCQNPSVVARAVLHIEQWKQAISGFFPNKLYLCAHDSVASQKNNTPTWKVRMFAPGVGVIEDAATGGAAASLAGWLYHSVLHGKKSGTQTHSFLIEQGVEINRPSEIQLEIDTLDGKLVAVRVGGYSVAVETPDELLEIYSQQLALTPCSSSL